MATLRLDLAADLAEVARLAEAAGEFAAAAGMGADAVVRLLTALDELITNIVMHGGLGATDRIGVALTSAEAGIVDVEIEDPGPAFDPLADVPQPEIEAGVEDRPVGGLGLFLVRNLTTALAYSRTSSGRNRLTFRVS